MVARRRGNPLLHVSSFRAHARMLKGAELLVSYRSVPLRSFSFRVDTPSGVRLCSATSQTLIVRGSVSANPNKGRYHEAQHATNPHDPRRQPGAARFPACRSSDCEGTWQPYDREGSPGWCVKRSPTSCGSRSKRASIWSPTASRARRASSATSSNASTASSASRPRRARKCRPRAAGREYLPFPTTTRGPSASPSRSAGEAEAAGHGVDICTGPVSL